MPADGGAVRLAFLYAVEISALERDGVDRPKFFCQFLFGSGQRPCRRDGLAVGHHKFMQWGREDLGWSDWFMKRKTCHKQLSE